MTHLKKWSFFHRTPYRNQTGITWALVTEAMATAMRVVGEQWRQLQWQRQ
jgi:hypothetical protein